MIVKRSINVDESVWNKFREVAKRYKEFKDGYGLTPDCYNELLKLFIEKYDTIESYPMVIRKIVSEDGKRISWEEVPELKGMYR